MSAESYPEWLGPVLQMGQAATEERAAEWALVATGRGASGDVMARAWREWRAEHAQSVQTIGDRCLCSHARSQHSRKVGTCALRACGCSTYRPGAAA